MSSDGYFDDELDSAVLQQFDIIDAQYRNGTLNTVAATKPKPPPPPPQPTIKAIQKPRPVIVLDDSDEFGEFDDIVIDEAALRAIDQACADAMAKGTPKTTAPIAGPSHRRPISRTSSKATVQTTLDGRVLTQSSPPKRAGAPNGSRSPLQRRTSSAGNNVFRGKSKKTKQWDHTAFAKTGWKQPKGAKGKEKAFGSFEDEETYEDEEIEFEQFPAPFMPIGPPVPMKLQIDRLAARRWIYPLNQPKRDYQYNIVRKCLYENTLVALPTGLGKTFIAGVVMLNFYTWFPEGKVVFVAPTKPLVAQQIDACHKTCGIPGSHAAELTGQNSRQVRARAWEEKRVFYMTPQTLMNDLRTDNCDPRDIVLLVIDEAHKGSGDYAYAQVIRYLMAKNPHFRVLALTATPGSKPETVQTIVDALHISHIEIRDEQSLDLKQYMHKKHTVQHVLPMSEEILRVRDLLAKVMDPMIKKLAGAGILHANPSPVMIHPFVCLQAMKGLHGRGGAPWAFPMLQKLNSLARAMGYLYECSISQCYTCINEIMTAPPKGKQKENPNKSDPNMQAILQELEAQRGADGSFPIHPKFEKLKALLIEHFAQKQFDKEDADADGRGADVSGDSRVMLFSTYRQCVDEIVQFLNKDRPMIRAIPFIGQSTDKSGKKGYGQKEQLEVIKKFKAGEYNVLVSTSIGEEGLDIGEIDMIICYEAQKSSVRMLQRIGRTGRKRDGHVHVMMSEVREERNWDRANENYEDVQRFIIRAEDLELYGDVGRLVPPEFNPEPIEQEMPIEEYVRDDGPPKRVPKSPKSKTGKGKTREKDPTRNIPRGAMSGFVSASKLVEKGRLSPLRELDSDALNSDSDDQEIMAGIHGPRRTKSMPSKSGTSKKKSLRRTVTTATGTTKKTKGTRKKKQELEAEREKSLDPADIRLEDDSDDEAIERGLTTRARPAPKRTPASRAPPKPSSSRLHTDLPPSSPEIPLADDIIDLTASDPPVLEPSPLPRSSPDSPPESPGQRSDTLVNKQHSRSRSTSSLTWLDQPSPTSSRVRPLEKATEPEDAANIAWLLDDDESDVPAVGSSPPRAYDDSPFLGREQFEEAVIVPDAEIEMILDDYDIEVIEPPSYLPSTPVAHRDEPRLSPPSRQRADMPPPPVPARFAMPSPSSDSEFGPPPSTFAVRGPGIGKGKKRARVTVDSSPVSASPSSGPPRRLQRGRPSSSPEQAVSPVPDDPDEETSRPNKRRRRRFQDIVDAQRHNPFMDVEADHSGNESSDGGMERDGEFGSEGDMQFVEELPATQASPSYDQSAVYRRSLMTQAGPSAALPAFSSRPMRRGGAGYMYATPSRARRPVQLSSPPERQHDDDEDDFYQIGSFIVDDEEDVSYATDGSMPSDP